MKKMIDAISSLYYAVIPTYQRTAFATTDVFEADRLIKMSQKLPPQDQWQLAVEDTMYSAASGLVCLECKTRITKHSDINPISSWRPTVDPHTTTKVKAIAWLLTFAGYCTFVCLY